MILCLYKLILTVYRSIFCSFNTHIPNYLNGKYLNYEKGEYYKTIGLRSCFSPLMIIYKIKNKHVFGCRLFGTFFHNSNLQTINPSVRSPVGSNQMLSNCYLVIFCSHISRREQSTNVIDEVRFVLDQHD
jgi:hypothetical protein